MVGLEGVHCRFYEANLSVLYIYLPCRRDQAVDMSHSGAGFVELPLCKGV